MFGREFNFAETLGLWDGIFVEDPTLQIVDYVSVAMLLRVRWKRMSRMSIPQCSKGLGVATNLQAQFLSSKRGLFDGYFTSSAV